MNFKVSTQPAVSFYAEAITCIMADVSGNMDCLTQQSCLWVVFDGFWSISFVYVFSSPMFVAILGLTAV